MIKQILEAVVQWVVLIAIRLPLTLLGLVVVPIALAVGTTTEGKGDTGPRPFTKYSTDKDWWWEGLHRVFWIWSNDRDGARGDKRGWWYDRAGYSFWSKYQWLALRNPVNNMRFVRGISVNMYEAEVELLAGQPVVDDHDDGNLFGWQWLCAQGPIFKYYTFYYISEEYPEWLTKVIPWFSERVFVFRIGHKIALKHNDEYSGMDIDGGTGSDHQRAWKGFTFRINPFLLYKE